MATFTIDTSDPEMLAILGEVRRQVADLNQSVQDLRDAVSNLASRINDVTTPLVEQLQEARNALDAERQAFSDYRTSEDQEDVQQNEALVNAQARVDEALANAETAANDIQGQVQQLNTLAQPQE